MMNDRLLRTSGDSRIKKYAAGILCAVLAVSPGLTGCGTSTVNSTSVSAAALQTADGDSSFYGQALAMLEKGDYQNAYTYFQSAINSEGHAAEGRRGQGICQLKLGNYDDAITLFDQACSAVRYPSLNEAFLEDCELYEVQACIAAEQYDKALTLCDSLIRGDRSGEAFLLRGTVYLKTEKYGQAAADFQHAIEADPS
ncbi:MAG: tetratricopeptide repeat protein, partial [Lachnospiraceae bacterium]|nr:tetratricopeptide repeat protein [Lachnospiraceae bacterium]